MDGLLEGPGRVTRSTEPLAGSPWGREKQAAGFMLSCSSLGFAGNGLCHQ